ncbi:hypothetical protein EC973_007031 [Apophysomyces ossiformis]|uniref:Uncharacterized protein n=1 Tax=Apophysomyces ossiformis TaxID=679940 RepID=A0A8H7EQN0_9FUNG|nr:hypothetical protein EC973_007031 [Apophysomyces ossiformis]
MTTYFIVNQAGDILYHSTHAQTEKTTDGNRIRYLPLLLIKDLIKANLHDRIQYVKTGNKTVVFWEKQGLLYVASTKRRTHAIPLLQHHLQVIHYFLCFNYGPKWHTRIQGSMLSRMQRSKGQSTLSYSGIAACICQLPFVSSRLPLHSDDSLCHVEQVELSQELRTRVTDVLRECCNGAFNYTGPRRPMKLTSFFTPPRRILPSVNRQHALFFDPSENSSRHWTHSFLFAREKIVAKCFNLDLSHEEHDVSEEFLYFLKLLVSQHINERSEQRRSSKMLNRVIDDNSFLLAVVDHNIEQPGASMPQDITRSSQETSFDPSSATDGATPSTTSASSLTPYTSSCPSDTQSQKSLLAYVYDASSSVPFKLREKSSSSVTLVSPHSATPSISWSSPPQPVYNHLLNHLPRRRADSTVSLSRSDMVPRETSSSSSIPTSSDSMKASDIRPLESQLPPNAKARLINPSLSNKRISLSASHYLSSSVPSETGTFTYKDALGQLSAPSSPTLHSRRNSLTDNLSTKDTSRQRFISLLCGEDDKQHIQESADGEGELTYKWVDCGNDISRCSIFISLVNEELCTVVIYKDDEKPGSTMHSPASGVAPPVSQLKTFRLSLQEALKDFSAFLLTKEATHFTILSFAVAYPGLIHFIYLEKGVMASPQLLDLNESDKDHELLHNVYQSYDLDTTAGLHDPTIQQWRWPCVSKLEDLVSRGWPLRDEACLTRS